MLNCNIKDIINNNRTTSIIKDDGNCIKISFFQSKVDIEKNVYEVCKNVDEKTYQIIKSELKFSNK